MVGFNFAPQGWALCNGQILSIAQNQALFSLLGTTYGGDGVTTFALPDLRGRVPLHMGQGPGLTQRVLGERSGEELHTLTITEMPAHTHTLAADSSVATADKPDSMVPARNGAGIPQYSATPTVAMSPSTVGASGGNQPHNTMQPYLCVNFVIALQGIYPSHSSPDDQPPSGGSEAR